MIDGPHPTNETDLDQLVGDRNATVVLARAVAQLNEAIARCRARGLTITGHGDAQGGGMVYHAYREIPVKDPHATAPAPQPTSTVLH